MSSKQLRKIHFTSRPPACDRRHFVDEDDVRVVLSRLPEELWRRLRGVHFNDRSRGRHTLAYTNRGRREIGLCALPPRISLGSALMRYGGSPERFGAVKGCQWPTRAVRRFMLYDTLLHEIGHFQIIDEKARSVRRKFAMETKAQEFSDFWRDRLWSSPFEHPDPVHNPPAEAEVNAVKEHWAEAHGEYKKGLLCNHENEYARAFRHFSRAVEIYGNHSMALEELGIFTYLGIGVEPSNEAAVSLLQRAVELDPAVGSANLVLARALASMSRESEARHYFERALKLHPFPEEVWPRYADCLEAWGQSEEAAALRKKARRKSQKAKRNKTKRG